MLQMVLDSAGLDPKTCAGILGFSPDLFAEWSAGRRPIPESVIPLLSAVFSVPEDALRSHPKSTRNLKPEDVIPAIWFKFRGPELVDADRESIVMIRQIGHFLNELEELTGSRAVQWKSLFDSIRNSVDLQAAPREQGRAAARIFRESTSLGHGASGSGEVMRGVLRSLGVLVIEIPVRESRLEGCSFSVGSQSSPRPCIFGNTHHVTWFRRNMVLMHEIAHSIFEFASVGPSLDMVDRENMSEPFEMRAQAFAQECLVPKSVLLHVAQARAIKWNVLSARSLARIVADTHVEMQTVLSAAVEACLVTPEAAEDLRRADISSDLHEFSEHALSAEEYLEVIGHDNANAWLGKRTTTLFPRSIRLPIGYVKSVVDAYRNQQISLGKAAEYLMISDSEFIGRFGDIYENADE